MLFGSPSEPFPSPWASLNIASLRFKQNYLLGVSFWENSPASPLLRSPRCPTGFRTNQTCQGSPRRLRLGPTGNAPLGRATRGRTATSKHTAPAAAGSPVRPQLPVDSCFGSAHQTPRAWSRDKASHLAEGHSEHVDHTLQRNLV